jgi:amino acid transporter
MADSNKMGFNATWSMAVGGMVGGGIFSVLGVIIDTAGRWSWLSFVLAGIVALISAYSYSRLAITFQKSGGAFTFLNEINHRGFAGSLSWVLILGYILTISVYAFTFGHYVAHVFDAGSWVPRVLALAVIGFLAFVNLRGVQDSSRVEIITVWGKLMVLLGLAAIGLYSWQPEQLTAGVEPKPWTASIIGAATIFMAYEGFQLLSYDYEDINNPRKILPRATMWAVVSVIVIYILVCFGATMLVGAKTLIEKQEVALSVAGKQAMGETGLILVTIAAAFSTGSAINATLFSTSRLMETVADKKDLPHIFLKENNQNIPTYAVLFISTLAGALAVFGSLGMLVDAASLIFLFTFGTVNVIAFKEGVPYRYVTLAGAIACAIAIVLSAYHQLQHRMAPFLIMLGLVIIIFVTRPYLLRKFVRAGNSNKN